MPAGLAELFLSGMAAILLILISLLIFPQERSFKEVQMAYQRVGKAYDEKYESFRAMLANKGIDIQNLEIYIRIFKSEQILELWGKEKDDEQFQLIKEFAICASSGHSGPKRREGDGQVPEGFYYLDHFNPWSHYLLSISIDYPNMSDRILGDNRHPGGNICIHGNCVTIGCIPLTDDGIKELYMAAVEAKNNSRSKIHVSIFPCRLDDAALKSLRTQYEGNQDYCNIWEDMKKEYDHFQKYRCRLPVSVGQNGRYRFDHERISAGSAE
jgi:murein L,D-transpeptidase YafK